MFVNIYIIAAVGKNNGIGLNNKLPWNIPEDLKRFKQLTTGKTVLMGRNTYLSIISMLGKPLPNRTNVVVSDIDLDVPPDVKVIKNFDPLFSGDLGSEIYAIGGAMIYKQLIGRASKLFITWIDKEVEADAFFPPIIDSEWSLESKEQKDGYSFCVYNRK